MKRWFGVERLRSEKNGEIVLAPVFGRPDVSVNGTDMSSPYMRKLWQYAVKRVGGDRKRVLMLGLGTGSGLGVIRKRFPGCEIVVLEWDSVMIDLFHAYYPDDDVEILQGDVREVLPMIDRTFDLVLVDLFQGHDPAPALYEDSTIRAIARVMDGHAVCVLNAYEAVDLIDRFAALLPKVDQWFHQVSHVAAFSKPGA